MNYYARCLRVLNRQPTHDRLRKIEH